MPKVVRDKEMAVTQEALFRAISEFHSYPEFLPEVVSARVLPGAEETKKQVTFELEIVKRFEYTLEFSIRGKEEVAWRLMSSNFFKSNDGKWSLKALGGGKTQVHYELDVGFGFLVPGWVSKKLTEVNLPRMFEAFEARAKRLPV